MTEMADVFDGMAALGVSRAIVVGTSRGGIIGMMMAMTRRSVVAGLVLNDIGPAVEARGLARIKTYVGRTPSPDDWEDAAQIQRRLHSAQFPRWTDADWDQFARLTYREENGRPVSDYDPKLATTLAGVEFDRPVPALWDEFRTLAGLPMLALRGANSDLLSAATVETMRSIHPGLESIVIPDEGHPPQLRQPQVLARISAFITAIEGSGPSPEAVVPKASETFDLDRPA
jgi:pimeloyl-ACP methyl ester carboxylesterase